MFGKSEKIFTIFEKPEASEPTDRVVLLRDGFAFWALIFGGLWLIANRMWGAFLAYLAAAILLGAVGEALHLSHVYIVLAQLWLQVMIAFSAYEVQGYWISHRGYRFAGILTAESEMHAQRRYYEFAT